MANSKSCIHNNKYIDRHMQYMHMHASTEQVFEVQTGGLLLQGVPAVITINIFFLSDVIQWVGFVGCILCLILMDVVIYILFSSFIPADPHRCSIRSAWKKHKLLCVVGVDGVGLPGTSLTTTGRPRFF